MDIYKEDDFDIDDVDIDDIDLDDDGIMGTIETPMSIAEAKDYGVRVDIDCS